MNLLDFVFPKTCVGCGRWGRYVCEACQIAMGEAEQLHPRDFEGLVSFWEYEGVVKKLITEAKYQYYFDQLRELVDMSWILLEREDFREFNEFLKIKPVLVPVPLYKKREKERGFNQAAVICAQIAKKRGLEVRDLLVRTKDTGQQVGRDKVERLVSMKDAFGLHPQYEILNTKQGILLVDDVWTTGATLRECVDVLHAAGFARVWGLVLAR